MTDTNTATGTPATAWSLRPIAARDDAALAGIIRTVMPEFGASGPGFAIQDAEVDAMHAAYTLPRAAYFVIEVAGTVLGGGGVAPLDGGDDDVCELRKMYFLPVLRGSGAGRVLIERCLEAARGFGFRTCYLETLSNMHAARALYERVGFRRHATAMGNTGHFGCNTFYVRDLAPTPD